MKCNVKQTNFSELIRPVIIGVLSALAVMVALIAAFSLLFIIAESIYDSAVLPLSLIAAAFGAFIGAYLCGTISKSYGIIFGAVVGLLTFLVIWVIGLFGQETVLGALTGIKAALLIVAGAAGGWLGSNRPLKGRWRRR